MALMSGSTTYEKLSSKYDNFLVPACKIAVGGTQIIGKTDVLLKSLEVKLSLEYAGSANFSLHGNYNYDKSSFPSTLTSTLKLGEIVEISLGYSSDVTVIFKGFITAVDVSFDVEDGLFMDVLALDARRLMQTDNKPYVLHTKTKYSDIVKDIMSRYSSLCKLTCDNTSEELKYPVAQSVSDYEFIMNEIIGQGNLPYEFFIVADEAYFRKTKSSTPILSLDIHSGLQSFHSSSVYLNNGIEVQGFLQGGKEAISATATAKNSNQKDVITKGTTVIVSEDCDRKSRATEIANNYKAMLESKSQVASGSTIGIPEIVPGRYVEIIKLDSTVNKKYYINEVTHVMSEDGFITKFNTKG